MTPAELHTAVLTALTAAEQAEAEATPAPWLRQGAGRSVSADCGYRGWVICSVDAYEGGWPSKPDAALIADLRNTAAAVYAGVRDITDGHEPTHDGPDAVCSSGCYLRTRPRWPCPDYRAAARMIPNLPQEVADALGHRS